MNVARTATSAVADRNWIEDEVWDEAFASRVRTRPNRRATPRTRPAPNWFSDGHDGPRPYGVDPPGELEGPFGVNLFEAEPRARVDVAAEVDATQFEEPGSTASPARRTIHIQGRGTERNLPVSRPGGHSTAVARRRTSVFERSVGFEPDRLAMWAMFLGVALVAVAILSSSL